MSLSYGFYNSVGGDRTYSAIDFSSIFDGIIRDGVFVNIGNKFAVTPASNGLGVIVGTGRAWLNRSWTYLDAQMNLAIDAADAAYSRRDLVVLEVNQAERTNSIKIVKGTPAPSPSDPSLTYGGTGGVYQYALATVVVPKNASAILSSNISGHVGDPSYRLPYVTVPTEMFDASNLEDAYREEIEQLISAQSQDYDDFIIRLTGQFNDKLDDYDQAFNTQLTEDTPLIFEIYVNNSGTVSHWDLAHESATVNLDLSYLAAQIKRNRPIEFYIITRDGLQRIRRRCSPAEFITNDSTGDVLSVYLYCDLTLWRADQSSRQFIDPEGDKWWVTINFAHGNVIENVIVDRESV